MSNDEGIYDFADEPARPAPPVAPEPATLAYAAPVVPAAGATHATTARPDRSAAYFPDLRRDVVWPAVLGGIGLIALYAPAFREDVLESLVLTSCYLLVKFVIMFCICLGLGTMLHFSFGTLAAAVVKVLALVAATDGWLFGWIAFDPSCGGVLIGIVGSLAVCALGVWKMTELEAQEITLTTALYWFPSLFFAWLIFRAALWLATFVL